MPSLLNTLVKQYPQFHFHSDTTLDTYRWDPESSTIFYPSRGGDAPSLLHELSHALLGHASYTRDIELLGMERDAWQYALVNLAPQLSVAISEETIQEALDSYRDWLHARSLCPHCEATGIQSAKHTYTCIVCHTTWNVNDARQCALRRYTKR